jgi:hypothetical protein
MARLAIDTRTQNMWKELIEKEASTRIACKLATGNEYKDEDEWFDRTKYTQKNKPLVKLEPTINFPPKKEIPNNAQVYHDLTQKLKETNTNLLSEMKPPSENLTKLLFDGFSKEEKGRYQYLKARKSDNPEDKFEYPLLSSFEYGWKLKEVAPTYKTPAHGRTKIVEDTFHRRNGVFPN